MAGITGMATTYNCPNFVGELFSVSPEDTPFLSLIGGLTGGESVGSTTFGWSEEDLRDADDSRQRLEGADAPTAEERARVYAENVLEIHQEAVSVSYTRQGARQMHGAGDKAVRVGGNTVPADELAHQIERQLKTTARDVEKTFITGKFQKPTDNTTPRKTRGILEAVTTNTATTTHTAATLTADEVLDLMQKVWASGGIRETETRTIMVNATLKRALTKLFIRDERYQETSRTVGGVNLKYIETDFGACNIVLNRYMPADKLLVVSIEQCAPAFLEVPGKGHFFAEQLATTGAASKSQLYGEIGLKYGNQRAHGVLTVATA
ncbi:hypothetical protein HMPREF1317_0123 [Schaalia georgiae F0490]|uniref:PF09950 family protein n=1 Tax=Schaalia georgiae F0490 TaxID=1125717 RepID=J1GQV2_9ACTO|nr:DUF5309 family protein [Schaalia georgiae]EJF35355.1 hypothetical protein HMPREF1317_0123 [Schaalia georgiae F0490]